MGGSSLLDIIKYSTAPSTVKTQENDITATQMERNGHSERMYQHSSTTISETFLYLFRFSYSMEQSALSLQDRTRY